MSAGNGITDRVAALLDRVLRDSDTGSVSVSAGARSSRLLIDYAQSNEHIFSSSARQQAVVGRLAGLAGVALVASAATIAGAPLVAEDMIAKQLAKDEQRRAADAPVTLGISAAEDDARARAVLRSEALAAVEQALPHVRVFFQLPEGASLRSDSTAQRVLADPSSDRVDCVVTLGGGWSMGQVDRLDSPDPMGLIDVFLIARTAYACTAQPVVASDPIANAHQRYTDGRRADQFAFSMLNYWGETRAPISSQTALRYALLLSDANSMSSPEQMALGPQQVVDVSDHVAKRWELIDAGATPAELQSFDHQVAADLARLAAQHDPGVTIDEFEQAAESRALPGALRFAARVVGPAWETLWPDAPLAQLARDADQAHEFARSAERQRADLALEVRQTRLGALRDAAPGDHQAKVDLAQGHGTDMIEP